MTEDSQAEPEGAVYLRILAGAMIRDYANFGGSKLVSWKAGRESLKAAKEAEKYAGLGSRPEALDYLINELTVRLADMTLRTTELARAMASDFGAEQ